MAGDWIRMRVRIERDSKVIGMVNFLHADPAYLRWPDLSDRKPSWDHTVGVVVNALLKTWGEAREQGRADGEDLVIPGASAGDADLWSGVPSLGRAMAHVGWLVEERRAGGGTSLRFPGFLIDNLPMPDRRAAKRKRAEYMRAYRERQRAAAEPPAPAAAGPAPKPRPDPKPVAGGADLFGGRADPPAKPPRPRNEMFDAVAEMAGADPKTQGSRVAKLAADIAAAGITPGEFRAKLPLVVKEFAPYRTALDLNTIQQCWPWIRTPPATTGRAARPQTKGEREMDYFAEQAADVYANQFHHQGGQRL